MELRKYNILLSFPEKPGSVSLVHANGSEVFKSAPQEEFLIPEENNSNVVPPFNAYSPNGTVKVRKQHTLERSSFPVKQGIVQRSCAKSSG